MKKYHEVVNIKNNDGVVKSVKLKYKKYDSTDCKKLLDIYNGWVKLSRKTKSFDGRLINLPECISEKACAILLNYVFLNQKSLSIRGERISTSFDCFDPLTGDKIQVKACSVEKDLTSFGPKSIYDRLFFLDFYNGGVYDGSFTITEINKNLIDHAQANDGQTVDDQKSEKRRPHISLKKIIEENNLVPTHHTLTKSKIL